MNRKRRIRRKLLLLALMLLLLAAALVVRLQIAPFIREAARTRVINIASDRINDTINEQIVSGCVDYGSIVCLEKDAYGAITAVQTNMAEVNQLKTQTLALLSRELLEMDTDQLSIPLGSVLMPEFFAGSGPKIPIQVVSLSTTDADFFSEFTEAGINQTQQRIILYVSINICVQTPAGSETVTVSSELVVAQTIIVGAVPESYIQLGGTRERNEGQES